MAAPGGLGGLGLWPSMLALECAFFCATSTREVSSEGVHVPGVGAEEQASARNLRMYSTAQHSSQQQQQHYSRACAVIKHVMTPDRAGRR